jgi:hypothetical protein
MRMKTSAFARLLVLGLAGCGSPPAPAVEVVVPAPSAAPSEVPARPVTPPAPPPIRFNLADAGGAEVLMILEALSGKKTKVDADAEPALGAARITITNEEEIEPRAAVKMIVAALAGRGMVVEEEEHRWSVHRAPSVDSRPRCVRAGGTCVGPAAIRARPSAPCAPGMHRVDDVVLPGEPAQHPPACYGIRLGEEACCVRDATP